MLSARHAQAAVTGGLIRAGTGKRAPLAALSSGDRVVIYSPRTDHPNGDPVRAVTAVGTVTDDALIGDESAGFARAATMVGIEPVPLDRVRELLPLPLLRFGCIALSESRGEALWAAVAPSMGQPSITGPPQGTVIVSGPVGNDR